MRVPTRFLVNLLILTLIVWLPFSGTSVAYAQISQFASIKNPAIGKDRLMQPKTHPPAGFNLQNAANKPAAAKVIAKYAGESTITVDVRSWFESNSTILKENACPTSGKSDLQLLDDGSAILTVTGLPQTSANDDTKQVTCKDPALNAILIFLGTYTKDPNKLIFSTTKGNIGSAGEITTIAPASGEGSFTDSSAEGNVQVDFIDVFHVAFVLNVVGGTATPEPSPTPGMGCTPSVGNISGLKPGDTLSPSADFTDPDGKEVAPLSYVWYINGQQTYSTTWDGKDTTLELQYVCPDNSAHTKRYTVPAYVAPKAPSAQEPPIAPPPVNLPSTGGGNPPVVSDDQHGDGQLPAGQPSTGQPGNIDPATAAVAVALAAAGAAGAAGLGSIALINIIRNLVPSVSTPAAAPASYPQVVPQAPAPLSDPPPQAPTEPPPPRPEPPTPDPQPNTKLTPADRTRLESLRSEMQSDLNLWGEKYQTLTKDKEILIRLYKNNLLKFIMKKGEETREWITTNPVDFALRLKDELSPEKKKFMDRIFEKHDTSKDSNIILNIKYKIDSINEEMHEARLEAIHLKMMIEGINKQLAGGS